MEGGFAQRDGLTSWLPKADRILQVKCRADRQWRLALNTHTESSGGQTAIGHQALRDGR